MSREQFLARVRDAAAAGRAYRVHAGNELSSRVGYQGGGDDLVMRMATEVTAVGGQAHVVDDVAAARAKLAELLSTIAPQTALCWRHPLLERLDLAGLLAAQAAQLLDYERLSQLPAAEGRAAMLEADVGITSATYAVAETGTLVMASAPGSERLASLLPPVHIAVTERSQILADLFDLFDRLTADGAAPLSSNLTLITGPSKTGDIELTLTTGVHGPGEWHVIVVR